MFDISDRVWLADGVIVARGGELIDQVSGLSLHLTATAELLVGLLSHPTSVSYLNERLEAAAGDGRRSAQDTQQFLSQLNELGLLRVKKDHRLHWFARTTSLRGERAMNMRRFSPTLPGLVRAVLFCARFQLAVAALTAVALAGVLSGSLGGLESEAAIGLYVPVAVALLNTTVLIHEWGHLAALRWHRSSVKLVRAASDYISVSYERDGMDDRARRQIAMAGPAAAAAALTSGAALALWQGAAWLSLCCGAMAAAHLGALLPWASDGRIVWGR